MTTPTTLQRSVVAKRLYKLVKAGAGSDVDVSYGPLLEPQTQRLIIVGAKIRGQLEIPHMRAGRQTYDDRFTIDSLCTAWDDGGADFDTLDSACQALAENIHDVVADRPHLEEVVGGDGLPGLVSIMMAELDGPDRYRTEISIGAAMRVQVACHARVL